MKASNDPAISEAQATPALSTTETSIFTESKTTLRREIVPAIEPIAGPAPIIDFTSSDQSLDRYNEVIVAAGWRLDNYRKNPVVQNAHQYGDILFTIGK